MTRTDSATGITPGERIVREVTSWPGITSRHPDPGETTRYIREDADAGEVVALLRIDHDRVSQRPKR